MTWWRMTKGVAKHPTIQPDEEVVHASYGLSSKIVSFANRAVRSSPQSGATYETWNADLGATEGLADVFKTSGVLALTNKRLLFFAKRFAIGTVSDLTAQWTFDQVVAIEYDAPESSLTVKFVDQSWAGLHSPGIQRPQRLADGFRSLKSA